MNARTNRIFMIFMAAVLLVALFAGVVNARPTNATSVIQPSLHNVRDYAAALVDTSYAVDGGVLFAGGPNGWQALPTPDNVIVSAVTVDASAPNTLFIGAANDLAIYRSTDGGQHWLHVPLSDQYVGGVTDIAIASAHRLVYVGTDTAGLFRLRDVGSSLVVGGHLQLAEPVLEVAADSTGAGLAFARTGQHLFRAADFGLTWYTVENLGSAPTALTIANGKIATVYVGTVDRGVVMSHDGLTWTTANAGLGLVPGSRLQVDALAVDPQQPTVLYAATSYLYGTSALHQSPVGVAMSTDGAQSWRTLHTDREVAVAGLLLVSGITGAVYTVSNVDRTPVAVGNVPAPQPAPVAVAAAESTPALNLNALIAWIVAGLAALALLFAAINDLRNRRLAASQPLTPSPVQSR